MKPFQTLSLMLLLGVASVTPASAQIEEIYGNCSGITWPSCAAIMEIALKRLEGVERVAISIRQQFLRVDLIPGTPFAPHDIRDAVATAEVDIDRMLVVGKAFLEETETEQFIVAGADRFLLSEPVEVPLEKRLQVLLEIDDSREQIRAKLLDWKLVEALDAPSAQSDP